MAQFPTNLTPETFQRYIETIKAEIYMKDVTCELYHGVISLSKPLPLGANGLGVGSDGVFTYIEGKQWIIPQSK